MKISIWLHWDFYSLNVVCFEAGSHYVAQADNEFTILLPPPPGCLWLLPCTACLTFKWLLNCHENSAIHSSYFKQFVFPMTFFKLLDTSSLFAVIELKLRQVSYFFSSYPYTKSYNHGRSQIQSKHSNFKYPISDNNQNCKIVLMLKLSCLSHEGSAAG
jgi:hypothetical protein